VGVVELVIGMAVLAVAGFVVVRGMKAERGRPEQPPMRPRPIAEARSAEAARIVGEVQDGEKLAAPLSGRLCVHYVVMVVRATVMNKAAWAPVDLGTWREPPPEQLLREERGVSFCVVDGSGRALVDSAGAVTELMQDWYTLTEIEPLTEAQRAFLLRNGLESHVGRPLALYEAVLQPGDRVSIQAVGVREPEPEPVTGYREQGWRLRMGVHQGAAFHITDRPDLTA
jgi:hypothetical protein